MYNRHINNKLYAKLQITFNNLRINVMAEQKFRSSFKRQVLSETQSHKFF